MNHPGLGVDALTLRLGVKGSGSLMFLGNALRMRLRIWMQVVGMASQSPW